MFLIYKIWRNTKKSFVPSFSVSNDSALQEHWMYLYTFHYTIYIYPYGVNTRMEWWKWRTLRADYCHWWRRSDWWATTWPCHGQKWKLDVFKRSSRKARGQQNHNQEEPLTSSNKNSILYHQYFHKSESTPPKLNGNGQTAKSHAFPARNTCQ